VIQDQHRNHPDAAADALHADVPAFQLGGSFNLRVNDEGTGKPIEPGDKYTIQAAGTGAQRSAGAGAKIKLRLPAAKAESATLPARTYTSRHIQTLLAKKALVFSDQKSTGRAFIETRVGNYRLTGRMSIRDCKKADQQRDNEASAKMHDQSPLTHILPVFNGSKVQSFKVKAAARFSGSSFPMVPKAKILFKG
jgi:hypothetical protein